MPIRVNVEREKAQTADLDEVIARLDHEPGLFFACEAGIEGIHERGGWAFAGAPLVILLADGKLTPIAANGTGAALSALLPGSGEPVAQLRALMATLSTASPELALFGAWSFDYRSAVLFLPDDVLRIGADGALERMRFTFAGLPPAAAPPRQQERAKPVAIASVDDFRPGEYAPRVAEAVARIRRGEVASLVLSQSFRRRWQGSAAVAFQALRRANPNPVMFLASFPDGAKLFGASPDMQVRMRGRTVESAPVCGTLRRGIDPAEDAARLQELIGSGKEEASLAVCSDADQVDKAAFAVPGTIELAARRRPMFLATIIHTVDLVRAEARKEVDSFDVLFAQVAPATIAGFPKATALKLIAELEASPRGWYGGAITRIGADGTLDAGTILRAASISDGVAEVRTGGGLMPGSVPEREEAETYLKAEALFRALGLAPPSPPPQRRSARLATSIAVEAATAGDAFAGPLLGLLERIGARAGGGDVMVVSGALPEGAPARPLVAIGDAALALLRAEGATLEELDPAWSARKMALRASEAAPLAPLGRFKAGFYAREGVRALPEGWRIAAQDEEEGWIGAAVATTRRAICLLFRPESIVSQEDDAGARAVAAALGYVARIKGET